MIHINIYNHLHCTETVFLKLQIYGPDGKVIHQGDRESNGKYTFAAHMDGVYRYCFNNKMSTVTPKILMFTMDIGEKPKETDNMESDGITGPFFKSHSVN